MVKESSLEESRAIGTPLISLESILALEQLTS
jgi:hypothetical protein